MKLKMVYDKQEDIPAGFEELYTEKDGKHVLTGVEGMPSGGDVTRLTAALNKERKDHGETKAKLKAFDGIDPEEARGLADTVAELQIKVDAAGKDGKVDDAKIDALVEGRVKTKMAKTEKALADAQKRNGELETENGLLKTSAKRTRMEAHLRKQAEAQKLIPSAIDDVVTMADRFFDEDDSGAIVTREVDGIGGGLSASDFFTEMKGRRPHWWPMSEGGGAGGGGGKGGLGDNPWTEANWSLTKQMEFQKKHGEEKARAAAKQAGVELGASSPKKKSKAA